jgi:hypothetical protein
MPTEQVRSIDSSAIEQLKRRLSKFETEEGRLKGLSYQPRANDIVITTTPKVRHSSGSRGIQFFDPN